MDRTLLSEFREAVIKLGQLFEPDTVEKVHTILFTTLYNAREFVRNVNKLSCIQENRAVDASVGLRDKLKVYAINKNSIKKNILLYMYMFSQRAHYYLILVSLF